MDNIQRTGNAPWFPRELKVVPQGGSEAQGIPTPSDRLLSAEEPPEEMLKKAAFGRSFSSLSCAEEREGPHKGLLPRWLQNSIVGLFVGLALLSASGCKPGTNVTAPPNDKPTNEKTVETSNPLDFTSNEEFKKVGKEVLGNLCEIVHRYGGDFYGKTESGPSENPVTPDEAYDILAKGGSFYFKGSANSDPLEVKNVKELRSLYREVLAEAAKSEVESQLGSLGDSLKNSEYGQKVLTQIQELAQKHGGNFYGKGNNGKMTEAPLTAADAYKNLALGKSIFFKGSDTAEPLEVKSLQQLAVVYQQVLKEAAVAGITDQGIKWIEDSLKDSTKAQQIITHLQEITSKFGGNIYGKTKDGPTKEPITPTDAYKSLAKGDGIFLKTSTQGKPIEIKDLQQLGTVYQDITKEITASGTQLGMDWIKNGVKDSQAAKGLLIHLNEMNSKYGGSMYIQGPGGSRVPLSPLEAYDMLSGGKSFFFQSSKDSKATEIKKTEQLIEVYIEALSKMPKGEGDKEVGKTTDLLGKLLEEQLKKFMPGGQGATPAPKQ
jgi:hypothetical protein